MTIAGPAAAAASNGTDVATGSEHAGGQHEDLGYETLYFLFLSLVLGAAARGAVRGTRLPYTVALLFLGLILGFLHAYVDMGVLGNSLDKWVKIGPHTMLSCFLPALVFESAFSLEWHTFRRCAAQVLWLAGPGVLVGTALVGALLKVTLPYGWGWGSCLMLGAILAATDPVAVVALLKEVGASKRLGHIIEGESLVNDGVAIVVFSLLNEIAKGYEKTPLEIFSFFVWVPVGAVLVGLGIAAGCHAWLGLGAVAGDHLVQISVTLFACYLCFLVAEFQAAASGVLAVVVLGVAIGALGRGFFTGETEQSLHHFWEMLTFVANTVLFILTGVIIAETTAKSTVEGTLIPSDLGWGVLVYLEVIFARVVVVGLLFPILTRCGYGLTLADAAVCVWGGLRGAVALALALVVSEDSAAYADKKVGPVVLLCTGVVVVLTLAVNGTTTGAVLQLVGLTRPEVSAQVAVRKARKHIREQCLAVYHEHLTTSDDVMGTADFRAVSDLVPFLTAVEEDETAANHVNAAGARDGNNRNGGGGGGGMSRTTSRNTSTAGARGTRGRASEEDASGSSGVEGIEMQGNRTLAGHRRGLMTPASSIADLAAHARHAEEAEKAAGADDGGGAGGGGGGKVKNANGQFAGGPDLAAAVQVAFKRDHDDMVAVWQRDVRGRFLAHLKVLYWEALEVGRATKEIVETLVECTDIALDNLDAPLGDWRALESHSLAKAQSGRPWWKRGFHALPPPLRRGLRWVQQWVLHSGAHPGGGARRRALVAVVLFHDAHQEARHAIFGAHHDQRPNHQQQQQQQQHGGGGGGGDHQSAGSRGGAASINPEHAAAAAHDSLFDAALEYDDDDDADRLDHPARTAAERVRAESEAEMNAAKSYLRAARTNEPELAAAVKSEETARRLLAVAERSAKGYVQSGLLTAVEAEQLLAGISRAQRRLRLDPPEPVMRDPPDLMRMMPLLDPTHSARVQPPSLAKRLVEMADAVAVRRFPGDAVTVNVPEGGLLLLARGVVEVTWARPFGDGGGGRGAPPLRVGASSTSYGWALGAADLLVPGAARFDMRAVSAVTTFVVPPAVVEEILANPGTAAALWRAAFGLLAATLLRDDLRSVPPQTLRLGSTKSQVTRHGVGETLGPFKTRLEASKHPPDELIVLMRGELMCEGEGTLAAPSVVVPGTAHALSDDQAQKFGKLAARMGNSAAGGLVSSPKKQQHEDSTRGGGGGGGDGKYDGRMRVIEPAIVLRCRLDGGGGGASNSRESANLATSQPPGQMVVVGGGGGGGGNGGNGGGGGDDSSRRKSVNIASMMSSHPHAHGGGGVHSVDGAGSARSSPPPPSPTHLSEGSALWPHSMDRATRLLLSQDVLDGLSAGGRGRMSLDVHQNRAVAAQAAAMAGSFVAAGQGVHATMRAGGEGQRRPTVGRDSFFASHAPGGGRSDDGRSGDDGSDGGEMSQRALSSGQRDYQRALARTLSDGGHTFPPRMRTSIPEHSTVTTHADASDNV